MKEFMLFFTRTCTLIIAVSASGLLSGCVTAIHAAVSPMLDAGIQSSLERNATPESMGVSTAQFRGEDCASLKAQADGLTIEKAKTGQSALDAKVLGFYVDAINQVRAEQGCDKPGQPLVATASPQASSGLTAIPVAVRPSSESTPVQGAFRASFDAVSPAFAKSLGLESTAGALVIDAQNNTQLESSGLRSLDVVTEVGGQIVKTPADLQAIVGRMRPGYKAQVRVWRQKNMRDIVIEVATPAR